MIKHEVYNSITGEIKGRYKNKKRARNVADNLDQQYGAIRFRTRMVEV